MGKSKFPRSGNLFDIRTARADSVTETRAQIGAMYTDCVDRHHTGMVSLKEPCHRIHHLNHLHWSFFCFLKGEFQQMAMIGSITCFCRSAVTELPTLALSLERLLLGLNGH
jgi:hypothetical protein